MRWNVLGLVIFNTIYLLLTLGGLPIGFGVIGAVLIGSAVLTVIRVVVAGEPAVDNEG